MCCALRSGTSNTEIIACATREGLLNANARNVFRFATPFAENGGEARALAAFILCGFESPAQQVEFVDPQTGKRYRVDFLWRARDGRIVVVELDGLVKYRDPQMMDGRTLGGVIDDERERSEGLKRGRGRDCAHPDGRSARLGRSEAAAGGDRCAAAAQVAAGGQPGWRAALVGLRRALVQYAPKLHG